jgi:hypothetical protein
MSFRPYTLEKVKSASNEVSDIIQKQPELFEGIAMNNVQQYEQHRFFMRFIFSLTEDLCHAYKVPFKKMALYIALHYDYRDLEKKLQENPSVYQ